MTCFTRQRVRLMARLSACCLCIIAAPAWADEQSVPTYNRDIRPILAETCFPCHGPDSAARKAGLRLDRRADAVDAGALIPGDAESSAMIERILLPADDEALMPPAASHKVVTDEQKDLLRRWVQAGGEYEPHWSLIAPRRPALPPVKDPAWVRNPIDQFVLAQLEAVGLQPAPEADRRTLARRLSLDLTGLPPEPAKVEAFVKDESPDAYANFVESLLASENWGEHRGRFWLDYARYADTHGIHFDNFREMWSYRDWVINAFNRNLSFDQFTIEQLAGDLLPEADLEQRIATGFNRCNITTNEGGAIDEEYRVLYARDRTETTGLVWMGLTTGCAVCHDHKFDPVTMRDFYSLAAFFNNTTQAAMDGNIKDTPPIVVVPQEADRPRWQSLDSEIPAAEVQRDQQRSSARTAFEQRLPEMRVGDAQSQIPASGLTFHALLAEGGESATAFWQQGQLQLLTSTQPWSWIDGHVGPRAVKLAAAHPTAFPSAGDFRRDQPFTAAAWIRLPQDNAGGSIMARMDDGADYIGWDVWLEGGRLGTHIIHKWQEDALKVVSRSMPLAANTWYHVAVTYDGSGKAAGVALYLNGKPLTDREVQADSLQSEIQTNVPFRLGQRNASAAIDGLAIQDVRLYDRALSADETESLVSGTRTAWILSRPAGERTPEQLDELFNGWIASGGSPEFHAAEQHVKTLQAEKEAIRARGTVAHVMNESAGPAEAYVLHRGEYTERRDRVTPDVPKSLPPMPEDFPRNRLGLARWLLLPEHPLTARVTVNRFWQEVFGNGLVRTSGDFGISGELPSHPELLDWLAVEFRESGWNVKHLFRLIVTSSTYRQSAATTPAKLELDPQNRWLSRGPRFRMDAEMVRDYALAASGLLAPKIGGASVRPYQPPGVWEAVAMIGSNTRDYREDEGESLYRRSMYTFWKRSAPPASMDIFNAPSRETCTVKRERTNTPLQALVVLNDPQFVEASRVLATWAMRETNGEPLASFDFMARRLLCRPLTEPEQAVVMRSWQKFSEDFRDNVENAEALVNVGNQPLDKGLPVVELAAMTLVANQLMNLDEVLNK
jgi:hypothetical protein